MANCRYLAPKGDGRDPWYWCNFMAKQVRPAEHGCGDAGCPKLQALAARAAARAKPPAAASAVGRSGSPRGRAVPGRKNKPKTTQKKT